ILVTRSVMEALVRDQGLFCCPHSLVGGVTSARRKDVATRAREGPSAEVTLLGYALTVNESTAAPRPKLRQGMHNRQVVLVLVLLPEGEYPSRGLGHVRGQVSRTESIGDLFHLRCPAPGPGCHARQILRIGEDHGDHDLGF